jgi:hypothetical protein
MNGAIALVLLVGMTSPLMSTTYFVSTTGNDTTNPGTIELPFRTIPKGISTASAGDTIYVRGGTYALTATISISRAGTSVARFKLYGYQNERPLLDFSAMPVGSNNRGVNLSGMYWHVRGLDIYKAGDNGMRINGSNNIVENCSFLENSDTGLQLDNGASNNQIINCDSYWNADPGQGNADGFAPKLTVGSGNYFYGCRAWENSDDGWDGYLRGANNVSTVIENSWCFRNGYLKNGQPSIGNGNGYKMGGSDNQDLQHDMTLIRCLAFDNRVKGFDQNNNRGSMALLNCTGFRNATNYSISQMLAAGETLTVKNCAALGSHGSVGAFAIQQTNSWMPPFVVTFDDFVTIDTSGMRGPRSSDGNLPETTFLHLASGSDLIDGGTNIGLPYLGLGPDLGAFEFDPANGVGEVNKVPPSISLLENYPNPFNPRTTISFVLQQPSFVLLKVFNALGQEVQTLLEGVVEAGRHETVWDAHDRTSGSYFCCVQAGPATAVRKLILLK